MSTRGREGSTPPARLCTFFCHIHSLMTHGKTVHCCVICARTISRRFTMTVELSKRTPSHWYPRWKTPCTSCPLTSHWVVYLFFAWLLSYKHRPSSAQKAWTEHIRFLPIKQTSRELDSGRHLAFSDIYELVGGKCFERECMHSPSRINAFPSLTAIPVQAKAGAG